MSPNTYFSAEDAHRLVQQELDSNPGYDGERHAAAFVVLVELADLYMQLIDPSESVPVEHHVMFPGLIENLIDRREERVLRRALQ